MMQFWKPTAIPEVIFSKLILAKFQGLEREKIRRNGRQGRSVAPESPPRHFDEVKSL